MSSFTIIGNELRTAGSLDFEAGNTRTVRIRATDTDGLPLEKAFTINLGNLDEPPVAGLDTFERPDTSPVLRIPRDRVLVNDTDPESRPLLILSVSNPQPAGATVTLDDPTSPTPTTPPRPRRPACAASSPTPRPAPTPCSTCRPASPAAAPPTSAPP